MTNEKGRDFGTASVEFPPRLLKSRVGNRVSLAKKWFWKQLSASYPNVFSTSCGEKAGAKWRYFVVWGTKPHILGDAFCGAASFPQIVGEVPCRYPKGEQFPTGMLEKGENGRKNGNAR